MLLLGLLQVRNKSKLENMIKSTTISYLKPRVEVSEVYACLLALRANSLFKLDDSSVHPFQSHKKQSPVNPKTTTLLRAQSCSKQAEISKALTKLQSADTPHHLPCGGTPGRWIVFFGFPLQIIETGVYFRLGNVMNLS